MVVREKCLVVHVSNRPSTLQKLLALRDLTNSSAFYLHSKDPLKWAHTVSVELPFIAAGLLILFPHLFIQIGLLLPAFSRI